MTTIWQDVRVGGRMLVRKPGFAVAVMLCLGLGIGGVTAVFSVVNGVTVRREAQAVDPSFKVESVSTMQGFHSELTAHRRFLMAMLSVFAGVAFALAVIGIYGVVAFTVSMRVREMGIRIALGAQRPDILRLVLRHAAGLTLTGVAFGLLAAFALRKVIASQLFGISPLDPLTLGIGILLLSLVPMLACYLPARRAARTDPMEALRCE